MHLFFKKKEVKPIYNYNQFYLLFVYIFCTIDPAYTILLFYAD